MIPTRMVHDPKPTRVKDKTVYAEFHSTPRACLVCGDSNVQAAHLLGGKNREDVLAGLIPLCPRCHGAWHGAAYREEYGGKRVTPEMVKHRVAKWIIYDPDAMPARLYLTAKLGANAAIVYVEGLGMPEVLTVQAKEVKIKEGAKNGRPWKSRLLVDANDDFIGSTFGAELDEVKPGQTLEVEREQNGDYWNIVSVKPAADGAAPTPTPQLGTGQYVKGKEAPETRAGISASVALKEAVNTATLFETITPDSVLETADQFFDWLMSKTAAAVPQEAAQSAPGASSQPITDGQITEIKQLIETLGTHAPASPDPNHTWTHEVQIYCKANFDKGLISNCSKAEAHQVIGYLEERITAIQAEAALPF